MSAATSLDTPVLEALFQEASTHYAAGRNRAALAPLERLLAANDEHPDALNLRAIIACDEADFPRARRDIAAAVRHGGESALRLRNQCEILRRAGDAEAAVAAGQRAVAIDPEDMVALLNLAMAQLDLPDPVLAAASARQVVAREPRNASAHFALAQALLAQGHFEEGWRAYEWRWGISGAEQPRPARDVPQWDGRPLGAGRLLLFADQGFGDAIQFARFLPWVRARCPDIVIRCAPALRRLLMQAVPGVPVLSGDEAETDIAAHLPFTSLAHVAGTTLETIPPPCGLDTPEPAVLAKWRARLDALCPPGMRRIGLAWAGRPEHRNDRMRSTTLATLAPLLALPGRVFVALQKGPAARQIAGYFGAAPLVNLGAEVDDFADTQAVIAGLDHVVTVDTSLAHLAGSMARATSVLLPSAADWRWLLARADTPWYPSLRLYRQRVPGDFAAATGEILADEVRRTAV